MVLGSRDSGYGYGVVVLDDSIHLAARSLTTTRPMIGSCGPLGCIAGQDHAGEVVRSTTLSDRPEVRIWAGTDIGKAHHH